MVKLAKLTPNVAELDIEDVGLTVRCCRLLKHAGVECLGDVKNAPEELLAEFFGELKAAIQRSKKRVEQYYDA